MSEDDGVSLSLEPPDTLDQLGLAAEFRLRLVVLAEVGPWQVRDGATVIAYRTITLTLQTTYALVARSQAAPSGFGGDFVETSLGRDRLYLNDHVTVDCRHEGQRLLALKITVIEPKAED